MHFLRTLIWVVIAAFVAIIASENWRDVTLDLWGNLQADIKLPVLLILTFLLGFLPTWLIMRGKLWQAKRKLLLLERPVVQPVAAPPAPLTDDQPETERP